MEQILTQVSDMWVATFFRSASGAEIDLVLEGPGRRVLAIEIKRASAPRPGRGFQIASEEIGATERYYLIPQGEPHPIGGQATALTLEALLDRIG